MSAHPDASEAILSRAHARAQAEGMSYAGAVTPEEAHALAGQGVATIVDVRTRFEAEYVGRIDGTALVEWKELGAASPNEQFLAQLSQAVDQGAHVLFLCRSGVRSKAAATAATAAGYAHAYDIVGGFEGDLDENRQRGTRNGWRFSGLPWVQG